MSDLQLVAVEWNPGYPAVGHATQGYSCRVAPGLPRSELGTGQRGEEVIQCGCHACDLGNLVRDKRTRLTRVGTGCSQCAPVASTEQSIGIGPNGGSRGFTPQGE